MSRELEFERPEELSPVAQLVAECVRRLDGEGSSAIDALCVEHPAQAEELRRRLDLLAESGVLGRGRFGHYVLLRLLGRGGMGVVHLARDTRNGQLVALKALPGRLIQSPAALQRFRREAQAVAALLHPGLIPLIEAGESDGIPWFTMEWIDGRTLADLVDALRAMQVAAERLDSSHLQSAGAALRPDNRSRAWVETVCRLVLDVAEALHYAHDRGVIHRDVKPSNILVDGAGRARLFDFGLARVEYASRVTLTGDFTGTPGYVAPEQIEGSPERVDGRADVYALGVTLYELLTLRRPFEGASPAEVFERVARGDPLPPRRLNSGVGRDVEAICLTALERSPADRYASAGAMAEDLRAALELRPIRAQGPRWPRRLRRFAAQHALVTVAVGLVLVLVVGTPVMLAVTNARVRAEARRAQEQQASAEASRLRAELAFGFLRDMLSAPSPLRDGPEVLVREVLDRAAAAAPQGLAGVPRALAETQVTLGLSYYHLGLHGQAEAQFSAARAVGRAYSPALDDVLAMATIRLAAVLSETARLAEAERVGQEALSLCQRLQGERGVLVAETLVVLGAIAERGGDQPLAVQRLREALALHDEHHGPASLTSAFARLNLAAALDYGEPPQAQEAESLLREGIDTLRTQAVAGQERLRLAAALGNLAILFVQTGRRGEAIVTQQESLDVALAACGEQHPEVAAARVTLGRLVEPEDPQRAETLYRQALPTLRSLPPGRNADLSLVLDRLGELELHSGRLEDALTNSREALALRLAERHPTSFLTAGRVAVVLDQLGRPEEGQAVLIELLSQLGHLSAAKQAQIREVTFGGLVELCEAAGQAERAAHWRQELEALRSPPTQ